MNKDQFNELLRNPSLVSDTDSEALEKLLSTFPYCNSASALLAKVSSDKGSMFSNQKIKRAALYSPSREKLKFLLSNKPTESDLKTSKIEIETKLVSDLEIEEISLLEKKTSHQSDLDQKSSESEFISIQTSSIDDESKLKMQNLRDEIQDVLNSLKGLEAEFRDKIISESNLSNEPKKNPLDFIRDGFEGEQETLVPNSQPTKEIDSLLVDRPLKFYVHNPDFGKSLRNASSDLIDEYLNFRPFEVDQKPDIATQSTIIDRFLESNIQMPRFGDIVESGSKSDLSKQSTKFDDSLVSENIAKIFESQHKYKKAIEVYEKLKLKNPEKSTYFANKIENLNSLNK